MFEATDHHQLRRKLRAAYISARDEYRLCTHWVTFDRFDEDAWTAFEVSYVNLRQAESEYIDTAGMLS